MGRFWSGQKIDQAGQLGGIQYAYFLFYGRSGHMGSLVIDIMGIFGSLGIKFAFLNIFLGFFPIDGSNKILIVLGSVHFQKRMGLLRIISSDKDPTMGFSPSGVYQVIIEPR